MPGGGNIEWEEDAQKEQQFKFAASSDGEQVRDGFGQSWGSADSEYSSSLSSAGDERRNLHSNSKAKESANEERQGSSRGTGNSGAESLHISELVASRDAGVLGGESVARENCIVTDERVYGLGSARARG